MRASDFDILIVPRWDRRHEGDWANRWRAKLSTARFVEPADPHGHTLAPWVEAIGEAVRESRQPILFIGHGTGATAIAEAAHSLAPADVRGAFLVAPPDPAFFERRGATPPPSRRLPSPSLVVASRSDP